MSYREQEERAIAEFAVSVMRDANASRSDREAARRRLTADTREPDMSKLTDAQLTELTNAMRTASALLMVARGGAYVAPEIAPMPFTPRTINARSEPANASTSTPASAPELTAPIATPELAPVIAPELATTAPRYTLADIKRALVRTPLVRR